MKPSDAMANRLMLTLQRRFAAPVERVFAAFTEPEVIKKWWGPKGFTTTEVVIDLTPGGEARWCMVREEDGHVSRIAARVVSSDRPRRLILEMTDHCDGDTDWQEIPADMITLVTIEFREVGTRETEVTLRQEGFPDAVTRDVHEQGWASGLACLAEYLAAA